MTYGTILHEPKKHSWRIECEPHVAIRLKRIFGKVDRHAHASFNLSDTPENCRDLLWFMERYPLQVMDGELRLRERAREHEEGESIVQRLIAGITRPPAFNLAQPLRQYQTVAAAVELECKGLLLADDVGLGKTASSIGILTVPDTLPAVVVTLTHLPIQWKSEIRKFAPKLRVHIVNRGTPYDLTRSQSGNQLGLVNETPDVVIINYHKLDKWAATLARFASTVIFDECQELRREDSAKYKAAHHIAKACIYRMGLSATPIYNYGGEIFNVVDCIRPGALGTRKEFLDEWCEYSYDKGKEKIKNAAAFGAYMRESGLMLRRTREDVSRELPELLKIPQYVEADEAALDRVGASAAELARVILEQNEQYRGQKMQASEELSNMLRQATGIAKAPYVAEFVRMVVEAGERVVLYGWHREVYSIWLDKLADLNPVMFTGTESTIRKEESKRKFLAGETKVLIMSLRAGAGLDGLQGVCRTVIFGELDWSPGVHEQAVGRIHRDGQGDKVFAYFLVSRHGADPIISETLGLKQAQVDGIRNQSQELFTKLQNDGGHIKKLAEQYLSKTKQAA
jgi:SNF2 family DNA or RNA helicase